MTGDMPMMFNAGHQHSVYGLANMANPLASTAATTMTRTFQMSNATAGTAGGGGTLDYQAAQAAKAAAFAPLKHPDAPQPKEKNPMTRRLVQVLIADTDENVPLEQSMLYTGEQKLTDATDQELFFEIDLKAILEKHNAARVLLVNKKVKERVEQLEPAKIRDLKMVVINVASF